MKLTRDDIGKAFVTRSGRKAVLSNVATPINIKLEGSILGAYPYVFEIQRVGDGGKTDWYEVTMTENLSPYYCGLEVFDDDIVGEWVEPSVRFEHDDIIVIESKFANIKVRRHFHSETDKGILCYADGASSITSVSDNRLILFEHDDYTFHKYEISDKF